MPETGTKEWKVIDVREGKTEPNPHGGMFQKFYVDFEGSPDTYWRRREGDAPEVGKAYYGSITKGDYGPRFKKEKVPEGYSGGSSEAKATSSKGSWQPESERDPERAARILRQHSQGCAIEWAGLMQAQGKLPENFGPNDLKTLIDWFDLDAQEAGLAAR